MAPAGDFDTFSTIFEFYLQTLPFNKRRTQEYVPSLSAIAVACVRVWLVQHHVARPCRRAAARSCWLRRHLYTQAGNSDCCNKGRTAKQHRKKKTRTQTQTEDLLSESLDLSPRKNTSHRQLQTRIFSRMQPVLTRSCCNIFCGPRRATAAGTLGTRACSTRRRRRCSGPLPSMTTGRTPGKLSPPQPTSVGRAVPRRAAPCIASPCGSVPCHGMKCQVVLCGAGTQSVHQRRGAGVDNLYCLPLPSLPSLSV